eukprot:8164104-Pyramimonas_sp.AAC.3
MNRGAVIFVTVVSCVLFLILLAIAFNVYLMRSHRYLSSRSTIIRPSSVSMQVLDDNGSVLTRPCTSSSLPDLVSVIN